MQDTKHLYKSNDNESSESDVFVSIRKRLKRSIIDESSDKENTIRQSCISWI